MTDQEIRLKFGEMNAGEMRLARALVAWHEREIANLKAALPDRPQVQPSPWPGQQEAIDAAFQQIDEFYLDYKSSHDDWEHEAPARLAIAQAYDAARPQAAEIASLKAELAALRTENLRLEKELAHQLDMGCQAAVCGPRVALDEVVRRMEAVPQEEIWKVYKDAPHRIAQKALESVRARLIAAARGEGQAKPVVVNETPQDEKQPDLSGEGEKQPDEPAHVHQEPAKPWTPAVGDTVRLKSGGPVMTVTHVDSLSLMCAWMNASNELQVEPITTLCLAPAKP